jgi:hypothetical protein
LALLLHDQLRKAEMSVRDLCEAIDTTDLTSGYRAPSHATVQRRLRGEGLANERDLVEAIITICTPKPDVESVHAMAMRLLRKAASDPTPVQAEVGPRDGPVAVRSEAGQLQRRLIATQEELLVERKLRSDAVQESARSTAHLMSLLTVLGARSGGAEGAAVTTSPSIADLERALRHAEQERDAARSALEAARRRIQEFARPLSQVRPKPPEKTAPSRSADGDDTEIDTLERELRRLDPDGSRFAMALRRAIDGQLDGSHTGRFRWDQLRKQEKAALSWRVESELRREFDFNDGPLLDFELGGIEFEVKFSRMGDWVIPAVVRSRICLLVSANDQTSSWRAGFFRAEPELLRSRFNRDGNASLTAGGRAAVRWLHEDAPLPENVLAHLPEADITAIFAPRSGQARINELLRRAQHKRLSPTVVATVALQADSGKRVRDARSKLAVEGIIVLGASPGNVEVARRLGLPVPKHRGEWVSARVAFLGDRDEDTPFFEAEGQRWAVAALDDPIVTAPTVP